LYFLSHTGAPKFCGGDVELNYNVTRGNRFYIDICSSPPPTTSISYEGNDVQLREIQNMNDHKFRYVFDLYDLKLSDCSNKVTINSKGLNNAVLVKGMELKLDCKFITVYYLYFFNV